MIFFYRSKGQCLLTKQKNNNIFIIQSTVIQKFSKIILGGCKIEKENYLSCFSALHMY